MTAVTDDTHAADRKFLSETDQFQRFPLRVQSWVMDSPLASAQFAQFFRDGGELMRDPNQLLAAYFEGGPEKGASIHVHPSYYPLVTDRNHDSIEMERSLFAMLAHEIGHHSINSRTHKFTGTTWQENGQYRAEHEGMTVLNAFRIFEELQRQDAKFNPDCGSVGYGEGLAIRAMYNNWRIHHDDAVVIRDVANIVKDTDDKLTLKGLDNVPDYNGDGRHTHAERFRRDWEQSQKRRLNSPAHDQPQPDSNGSLLRYPEQAASPQALVPYSDSRHRDHALHETIRRHLPAGTSDEMAAHITLQAKVGRVRDAEHVDVVMVHEGRVFVMSKTPGFRTHVDLSETPPPIGETMQRSESLDVERAQQREQWMAQEQQLSQSRSLSRSL